MHLQKNSLDACRKKRHNLLLTLRHLLLLLCFCFVAALAHAQSPTQHKPISLDPLKDKIEYQRFTIRLIPTIDGYYGFDILHKDKLVLHQTENPLPNIRLIEKADAYLAAKWLINEYQKSGHFPRVFPPGFERQFHSFPSH